MVPYGHFVVWWHTAKAFAVMGDDVKHTFVGRPQEEGMM